MISSEDDYTTKGTYHRYNNYILLSKEIEAHRVVRCALTATWEGKIP